jgi:radical SAM superfamily enzyme YgiQ (UPF0313 family)
MKVLLVSPKSSVWNSRKHLPLGLGYLAAALEGAGHTVTIYDAVVEEVSIQDVLDGERYDLVGITSTTPLIYEAWAVAALAKERGIPTILGGPHPTLLPEESMRRPEVDMVLRGEGEDAVVELVAALEAGKDLRQIGSLSWKRPDGEIVHNPLGQVPDDIDRFPFPAHHLMKIDRYTNLQPLTDGLDPDARAYTIITSRGCPYNCIYCSKAITGRTWRPRSPASVLAEWRWLVRDLGATEIGVTDDVMTLDLDRAKEICRGLIDQGLTEVPWITIHGIKAGNTDGELLHLMKKAGCKRVGFGVESGNQRVLDTIKKQQTTDEVRRAFFDARTAGLQTMGFFIFGLPGETEETMDDTIQLALELDPDLANFMIAAPYPGTEMYEMILDGGRLFTRDWSDFAIHDERARFEIGEVTKELVERKWHEAYRRFYLRPGRVARRLSSPDTWRRLPTYARDAIRFFKGNP